jgi:uncharacterized protein YjbI with pentapeptide repeats
VGLTSANLEPANMESDKLESAKLESAKLESASLGLGNAEFARAGWASREKWLRWKSSTRLRQEAQSAR